jgi:hypothetical protein
MLNLLINELISLYCLVENTENLEITSIEIKDINGNIIVID